MSEPADHAPAKPAGEARFKELPAETQKLFAETAAAIARGLDRSADSWTNRVLTYLVLVNSGAVLLVLNQAGIRTGDPLIAGRAGTAAPLDREAYDVPACHLRCRRVAIAGVIAVRWRARR